MFELTINNTVYQFNFGMGFMREANKRVKVPVANLPGVEKNFGLQYMVASIIDRDLEALVDALDMANKSFTPRVTRATLDNFIDNEETDIDELFESVMGFLKSANATKKVTQELLTTIESEKAEK